MPLSLKIAVESLSSIEGYKVEMYLISYGATGHGWLTESDIADGTVG